jgi:hypothetical protein
MRPTKEQLMSMPNGTAVRVLSDMLNKYEEGDIIFRLKNPEDDYDSCKFTNEFGVENFMQAQEVELIEEHRVCGTIARPVLEERKVGKIAIELFDEGFPNAVMAIGEVMTWAAENKGYKPHDWKNLPNPDTAFLAAGSRHRMKRHIQRADGVNHIDCVDEESNLLHLAHEAFNVLAQLELVITNRIQ